MKTDHRSAVRLSHPAAGVGGETPALGRRRFLQLASCGAAGSLLLPRSLRADEGDAAGAPKVRLAWVGCGGMGMGHLRGLNQDKATLVAYCDADSQRHMDDMRERYPDADFYQDFRQLLTERADDLDAVAIATTDHVHFAVAYLAMSLGLHVFIEKPLTHTVAQARILNELASRKGLVTQMGNQGHLFQGAALAREWYEAGLIGDVEEVIAWTNRPQGGFGFRDQTPTDYLPGTDAPEHLDWDRWLGPTVEDIAYNSGYHPSFWRGWWDFGCGGLGDIGCHTLDTPFWSLDLGLPDKVEVEFDGEINPVHTVMGSKVSYHFGARGDKPPVKVHWFEGPNFPGLPEGLDLPAEAREFDGQGGLVMIGSKGAIAHRGMRPDSPRLYPDAVHEEFRTNPDSRPDAVYPRYQVGIVENWLDAIRGEGKSGTDFAYAAPLTEMILLGSLAIRTGKGFEYDGAEMKIEGNDEAAALLDPPAREGWAPADLDKLA